MGPEIGPADLNSVWNSNIRQRFNTGYTAGFYAIGAWTKRKLLAAMFKTGARTVSHLYFNTSFAFQYCISVSHLSGLKASSHMRFLSRHLDATFTKIACVNGPLEVVRPSFPVLSCQMFDKKIYKHETMFSAQGNSSFSLDFVCLFHFLLKTSIQRRFF